MKKIFTLLGILSTACGFAQQAFPPFTNVAITKPGEYASPSIYSIYTSSAGGMNFVNTGKKIDLTGADGKDINGIGLDPNDRLVYGAVFYGPESVNHAGDQSVWLYRSDANGDTVNLGLLPTGNLTPGEFGEVPLPFSGTVSTDDKYYYLVAGVTSSGVAKIIQGKFPLTLSDVNFYICSVSGITGLAAASSVQTTVTKYPLDITSDPNVATAFSQYVGQIKSVNDFLHIDGGIQDISISPANTGIYAYITYPDASNNLVGRPVEFQKENATTVKVSSVGTQANPAPGEADGAMFDASNNFYVLFVNGQTAQVDLITGETINQLQSSLPVSNNNLRGDLAGYITNIAMPVKMGSPFTVQRNGTANLLKWGTVSEINFSKFEIQHSTDNKTWLPVGYVASKSVNGNSSNPLSYSFVDASPAAGNNFYKLISIDLDGTQQTVGFVSISNSISAKLSIYPNPATDKINVNGITTASTAYLYDNAGRLVKKQSLSAGNAAIAVRSLAAGIYHLVIIDSDNSKNNLNVIVR